MNYLISNVKGRRKQYVDMQYGDPDAIAEINSRMLTIDQYHNLACRIICKWAPANARGIMLSSDDAIDYVAHHIMIGDWNYSEDKAELKTYRGYCGKKAISKYLTVASQQQREGHLTNFDADGNIYSTVADPRCPPADSVLESAEDYEESRRRVNDMTADLTDTQRACVIMHCVEDMPLAKIGRELGMTTEGVRLSKNAALRTMRKGKD